MDSTFFLTVFAAEIGFFKLFGAAILFFMLLGALLFMVFRKFRDLASSSSSSSSPPPSLCSSSSSASFSSSNLPSSSPPPSSSSCKWSHDVFLSFRGEDVRRNFLSHIQKEFRRNGITPFNDNEIKRGEFIGDELIQAIRRSKVAVVLLSRNYASSKWCLDELAEIMKCKKELGQTVFVIFYEVDPSDVKKLNGDFGAVFDKTCAGKTKEEDAARWRQALVEVATIAGYDSRNWKNEADEIGKMVAEMIKRLINSTPLIYNEGSIGMGAHMEAMKRLLCLGSNEVRVIGIWGPAGIGKTTIARVVYHQFSHAFPLNAFMDINTSYERPNGSDDYNAKLHFEEQLLSQLTNQKDLKISHLGVAHNFLKDKKALVVLDGVDKSVQLDAMPKAQHLGPGTRIIITTQDLKVLKAFGIEYIYRVNYPPPDEALQIFCISAFDQTSPEYGFGDLAWEVTERAGSLPLGLRIMGSHLKGMSKEEWENELPRLRIILNRQIGSILKLSYDALNKEDKKLFLYIACFFKKEDLNDPYIEDVLRHIFLNVNQGLQVLVQRSLLSMDGVSRTVSMHDLLVQHGREIVRNESNNPGKRQFIVDAKDIYEVLTNNAGSRNVVGININFDGMEDDLRISERAFEKMFNLQLLRLRYSYFERKRLQFPQGLKYLSPELRILDWEHYPVESLPSTFNPKFLVKIDLKYSKLEKLWEVNYSLRNLKRMYLSNSRNLKELPDLSSATNLQDLELQDCSNLVEIPSSIGNLTNLLMLDLWGCSSLVEIPSSIGNLQMLKELILGGCSKLEILPVNINLGSLVKLNFIGCWQLRSFPEISTHIEQLKLGGTLIEEVPLSVKSLSRLKEVKIPYCKNLGEFPNLLNVITEMELDNTEIEEFPLWFSGMSHLRCLALNNCRKLVSLPQLPDTLWRLEAENCESLERLACSFPNPYLCLEFMNCWKLNEEARNIIVQSTSNHGDAILPGREVPELFTYRSTSGGSVKANRERNSWRFQACISLVCKADKGARDDEEEACLSWMIGDQGHRYLRPLLSEHLYTFPVFANSEAEVFYEFELESDNWEIAQCGLRPILEEEMVVPSDLNTYLSMLKEGEASC